MQLNNILKFIKTWMLPPGWLVTFRKIYNRIVDKDKPLDKRRYWSGEPVFSPQINIEKFETTGVKSIGLTLNNETRDAISLLPKKSVLISLDKLKSGFWRFGISSMQSGFGNIDFFNESQAISSLKGIQEGAWSDVRLDADLIGRTLLINNNSNTPIYISHPVKEENANQGEIRNIIVIVLDSLTHDLLGLYQKFNKFSPTPNIDRFFKNSIIYENCFSVCEWTMPSIYSIFSGQYPITHGYTDLRNSVPVDWCERRGSLAELLTNSGYSSMACSTAKVFTPAFGAHAGFNRFFYDPYPDSGRTSRLITERAIDHLEANCKGKNFLFLHYIDTHEPWAFPSYVENCKMPIIRTINPFSEYSELQIGWGDTKIEPIYTEEGKKILSKRSEIRIQEIDLHLQPLFDYLETTGQSKDTVTILTSDHGYSYPGGRKPLLVDSRVHVPLLINHPLFDGQTVSGLVSHGIDLGPTIAVIGGTSMETNVGMPMYPFYDHYKRTKVLSESVFSNKYKVAVRCANYAVHVHYRFDIKKNKIDINKCLYIAVFNVSTNEQIPPTSGEYLTLISNAKEIVIDHVLKNSKAFGYSFNE